MGAPPPPLVQFRLGQGGRAPPPGRPSLFSTKAHEAQELPRGGSGNPRYSGFIRKFFGTLPVSEYSRPIYRSLCLDHFETPRHVRDHIRDSEQPSVHQNI